MPIIWTKTDVRDAPLFAVALLSLCPIFASDAHGESSATLTVQAAQDSNVFRLGPDAGTMGRACRSDQSVLAQGQIDRTFGAALAPSGSVPTTWTGTFSGALSDTRYRCNSALDNTGGSATWQLASPAFGPFAFSLNPSLARQQTSLEFIGTTGVNSQFLGQLNARAGLYLVPDVALIVEPKYVYSRNSSKILSAQDYDKYGGQAGIAYLSGLGNSISILAKYNKARGPYQSFADYESQSFDIRTNYREKGVDLYVNYSISALTRFNLDLGYLYWKDLRSFPTAISGSEKKYGRLVGNFRANYQPGNGTDLELSALRQFSSLDLLLTNGIIVDDFYFKIHKRVTKKLSASLKLQHSHQHFLYNIISSTNLPGSNKISSINTNLHYNFNDNLQIDLNYSHQSRLSGGLLNPFSENSVGVQLAYKFGKSAPCLQSSC